MQIAANCPKCNELDVGQGGWLRCLRFDDAVGGGASASKPVPGRAAGFWSAAVLLRRY